MMLAALNIARLVLIALFGLAWLAIVAHVIYGGFLVLKAYGRREQLDATQPFLRPVIGSFYRRLCVIFFAAVAIFILLLAVQALQRHFGVHD